MTLITFWRRRNVNAEEITFSSLNYKREKFPLGVGVQVRRVSRVSKCDVFALARAVWNSRRSRQSSAIKTTERWNSVCAADVAEHLT